MENRAHDLTQDVTDKSAKREARIGLALKIATSRPMTRKMEQLVAAVRGELPTRPVPTAAAAVRNRQVGVKRERLQSVSACEACRFVMPNASLMHLHHIVPVSQGGGNAPGNTALICPNCHATAHWRMRGSRITTRGDLFRILLQADAVC